MGKRSKLWLVGLAATVTSLILASVFSPRCFALTAFSDVVQCLLLLSGTAVFVPLAIGSQGRIRLFWSLIAFGGALWFTYQAFWTYYEVVLRKDVPDLCSWDVVLFLHIVPLMAAIALRPQVPRDEYSSRVGQLDFAQLLLWWLYLYVLIVIPWQYVTPDIATYDRNLNNVYVAEKLVLLVGLLACYFTSTGRWRHLYAALFGMSFCYSASSTVANWALARHTYYSGSWYDIPLVLSMASLTWIGLSFRAETGDANLPEPSMVYGVWVARCSMIAVFSLPLFAAWAISGSQIPQPVRLFRLSLTLVAALLMGVLVFLRQRSLESELIRLLTQSRESFTHLKRLQAQILQTEKVASVGQLVGGVAHEINNPLTAMMGYSDILLSTPLSENQQTMAVKIGHYIRRTRLLVSSLISFARQGSSVRTPLDLNGLARTAVKLTQPQWERMKIQVRTQFDPTLPRVFADSNLLLQVCLQSIGNCLYALSEFGGNVMTVSAEGQSGQCLLQFTAETAPRPEQADDAIIGTLGLATCRKILQDHQGHLEQGRQPDGSLVLRMYLPAIEAASAKTKEAAVPVSWQPQPSA